MVYLEVCELQNLFSCANLVGWNFKFLVTMGRIDGERICITETSNEHYTMLVVLVFRETLKFGVSLLGVADLSLLKSDRHKV